MSTSSSRRLISTSLTDSFFLMKPKHQPWRGKHILKSHRPVFLCHQTTLNNRRHRIVCLVYRQEGEKQSGVQLFPPWTTCLSLPPANKRTYGCAMGACEKVKRKEKETYQHKLHYANNSVLHPLFPTAAGCPRLSCSHRWLKFHTVAPPRLPPRAQRLGRICRSLFKRTRGKHTLTGL